MYSSFGHPMSLHPPVTCRPHPLLDRGRRHRRLDSLRVSAWLVCSVAGLVAPSAAAPPPALESPVEPHEAIASFQVADGLRIELAACEPQVVDPVAIRFDERGRMWVVEMRDYPNGPAAGQPPLSRIKVLTDRDRDGFYETDQVFAENLLFATGLQPWRDGVIVTVAGNVVYMRDSNGDGTADEVATWYSGFAEKNPQLRANHPTLSIDNQIYVANGLRGGTVRNARRVDEKPIEISGMDFRFDPHSGSAEAVTGAGQFGLTFDDWGNRFVCSNRNPLKHIVLEDRLLRRNPRAAIAASTHDVAIAGAASRIFPISRAWTTSNLHAGQFTAACGVTIYRGTALPDGFYGNALICDPTGNLVHREVLRPTGATFASTRAYEKRELLASRDEWCRPVNLENGPDGATYVVDMYRAVIEHPQWVPEELKRRPDLRYGDTRGRIYRLVAEHWTPPAKSPALANRSNRELVDLLEHANSWTRETAARLLLQRQDHDVIGPLANLVRGSAVLVGRAHALFLLDALDADDTIQPLLCELLDAPPPSTSQAGGEWFRVLARVAARQASPSPQLQRRLDAIWHTSTFWERQASRLQWLLSLGPIGPQQAAPLAHIALTSVADDWTTQAVIVAAGTHADLVLAKVLAALPEQLGADTASTYSSLIGGLAALAASGDDPRPRTAALGALVRTTAAKAPFRSRIVDAALVRFAAALASRGSSLHDERLRLEMADRERFDQHLSDVAQHAADSQQTESHRLEAIRLLGSVSGFENQLSELARSDASPTIRRTAIGALAQQTTPATWRSLLNRFPMEAPSVRRALLTAVLARRERTALLFEVVEAGEIKVAEIDPAQSKQLLQHPDSELKQRAAKLFADAIPVDRRKVLAEYQVVLSFDSDPLQGRKIFSQHCATCHRIGGLGVDVAPDISDSRTRSRTSLLTDILQPNRSIDNNYVSYTVVTVAGRVLTGVLAQETSTAITLRQPEGKQVTLLRSDIEQLRSNGVSLMPEGLEKNISQQDMADLIAFVKHWRYLDGQTPFVKPDRRP